MDLHSGGLIVEEGYLRLRFWWGSGGAYLREGLFLEGLIIGILRYFRKVKW